MHHLPDCLNSGSPPPRSRLPSDKERFAALKRFEKKDATRRTAAEDLMWAFINTPEFVFDD